MAISYVASESKYYGLSTDDKTSISNQEGAKIYYADNRKTQICHAGVWYDYNDSTSIVGGLASGAAAVTPSDSTDLTTKPTKGLYIGGTGDVAVIMSDGSTAIFTALSSGIIHPLSVNRIKATGTTATTILAVY